MRIIDSEKLDFSDVLLVPHRSSLTSRKEVDITREFHFKHAYGTWSGIPIVSSNMSSVTNWETASTMHQRGMLACMPKNLSLVSVNRNYINTFGMEGLSTFRESLFPRIICLDVANGYMERFADLVKRTREEAKFSIIIAGNVVTPEMTQELILSGADIVKVGIGSGSACATRSVAGVGFPQFSAVVECADAAHGLGGHIMSDGGCTTPGDVAKAFCAGADFVMLGGMLAGHDENGSEFYGESSERANISNSGGLKDYRASEGFELVLPKRGGLNGTLQTIEGGLRSCGAYIGATKLKDFPKCATLIKVRRILNESLKEYRTQ